MLGPYFEDADGTRVSPIIENDTDHWMIGRGSTCDFVLDLVAISRQHADVDRRDGLCRLIDLDSRNGTFVNGTRVGRTPQLLRDGDVVVLGGAAHLVFRDPMATPIGPRVGRLTGVWINPESHAVWVDAVRVEPPLSSRQLALLQLLVDHEGEVVSRITIVDEVWADVAAEGVSDDAVSALLRRLKSRLRDASATTEWIEIVKSRGVRLRHPD